MPSNAPMPATREELEQLSDCDLFCTPANHQCPEYSSFHSRLARWLAEVALTAPVSRA